MSAAPGIAALPNADNASLWRGVLLWAGYIALDTGSQLAFKWASTSVGSGALDLQWILRASVSPGLWLGIACYVGTLLLWLRVLARMDLSRAFPMSGISYLTVPGFAIAVFGESLTVMQAVGIAAICAGVAMLALERAEASPVSSTSISQKE